MKVVFFGASVTQQYIHRETGEMMGYIPWLKKIIREEGLEITIDSIAAGSAHFDNAGYVLLSKVLKEKPDILVIDWHSTALDKFDPLLWNAFLSNIIDQSVHLIIAILPRRDIYKSGKKRENHLQAEQVACESIHLLNGYEFPGFSPENHLRDIVHTTPEGGKFYALNFLKYLKSFTKKRDISDWNLRNYQPSFYVPLPQRPSVNNWEFNLGEYIKAKKISIKYEIECNFQHPKLVMNLNIGPDSPVLDILYDGEFKNNVSLWDEWCYFKRQNYRTIPVDKNKEIVEIGISKRLPDYSKCRNTEFDFSNFEDKYIYVSDIFIIGGKFKQIELI